jgi:hypothetical protein
MEREREREREGGEMGDREGGREKDREREGWRAGESKCVCYRLELCMAQVGATGRFKAWACEPICVV